MISFSLEVRQIKKMFGAFNSTFLLFEFRSHCVPTRAAFVEYNADAKFPADLNVVVKYNKFLYLKLLLWRRRCASFLYPLRRGVAPLFSRVEHNLYAQRELSIAGQRIIRSYLFKVRYFQVET